MTSTIRAVTDPTLWTAMSSCGPARWAARPTGGGWGWGCCSSAGSPPGCGCARRPPPTVSPPTPARAGVARRRGRGRRAGRAAGVDGAGRRGAGVSGMSEQAAAKVTGAHLARTAYLYVRQSTLRQVLTNTESAARQYALRQKAIALGWQAEAIVTIDTDQGQSGASAADREGFQRLVAEVGMGRAGIVLGLEVSRLARNNADWHRLLEICAMSATLICDEDGLYDPTDFNDRLLLGLKGTMSEAELHFIRARLIGGQLSKARRGELQHGPAGRAGLRPGRQGRARPGYRCATSDPAGVHACSPAPARRARPCSNSTPTGCCSRCGCAPAPTRASWPGCRCSTGGCCAPCTTPATPARSPTAAAANASPPTARRATRLVPREQWIALIRDAHPGYISWDQYETNQKLLLANATAHGADRAAGPAREGTALLQGLAICGRCGRRMTVRYHTRRGVEVPDYQCQNRCIQDGAARCQTVPGGSRRRRRRPTCCSTPSPRTRSRSP